MPAPQLNLRPTAVLVDDFLPNVDEVRSLALSQDFFPHPEFHKGERTNGRFLSPGIREAFEDLLGRRIVRWEEHEANGVFQVCKAGDQVVFHSDVQNYAGVLYLTPDAPPEAGTTLYRSRATKGRTVGESLRLGKIWQQYAGRVSREMYEGKLLDPTAWEVVDVFGNVYNRLVLWDARLVHAASCYFGTKKENARLFQMFFFDIQE